MAEELIVAHDDIDIAGRGLQGASDDASGDLASFQAELAAHGEPWGKEMNDPIGPLIGMAYSAVSAVALECYEQNIKALKNHGDSTRAMAATYKASEDASTSAVKSVQA